MNTNNQSLPITGKLSLVLLVATQLMACGGGGDNNSSGSDSAISNNSEIPIECILDPQISTEADVPVITLSGSHVVEIPVNTDYMDPGATAIDADGIDISADISVRGLDTINSSIVNDHLIFYDVADALGRRAATATRVVRVTNGKYSIYSLRRFEDTDSGMGYLEHLPVFYGSNPADEYPLIIVNHGATHFVQDSPPNLRLEGLLHGTNIYRVFANNLWPDSRPFIVLSPQRCNNIGISEWVRVDRFISWAIKTYSIDTTRIYMTGLSAGSYFTWRFPVLHPGRLAAIAPISAGGRTGFGRDDSTLCESLQTLPAWAFHGESDLIVPSSHSLDTVNFIRGSCGYPAFSEHKISLIPGSGHDTANFVWDDTFIGTHNTAYDPYNQSIYDWFLQFQKN